MKDIAPVLLPDGFLRLSQIVGSGSANPLIPVSKSTWWAGVSNGRFPPPIKLTSRVTVWRVADIRRLIDEPGTRWPGTASAAKGPVRAKRSGDGRT